MPADQGDSNPLAGSLWCQEFRVLQRLSSGAYGFVWLCLEVKTGQQVAIKFISRERNKIDKNVEREIINHSMLEHPHIIQFKLCFLTDKYLAIAMEYAGGEDLLKYDTAVIARLFTLSHEQFTSMGFACAGLSTTTAD